MAYIGNSPDLISTGRRAQYHFTAIAGQTAFSGTDDNGLSLDLLDEQENDVYFNGARLILDDDYTISGNTLTLTAAAAAGDILVVVTQDNVQNLTSYTKLEADDRFLNVNGDITSGDIQIVGEVSATSLAIDTDVLVVDDVSNRVGIGTTNPAYKTDITSASDADLLQIKSTASANNTALRLGISGNDSYLNASGGSTGNLAFKTYGQERMRIDSSGRVGIGDTSPDVALHVHDSSGAMIESPGAQAYLYMYANDRANNYDRRYIATENNGDFTIAGFGTGQWAKHLVIDSSGNVGIGETSVDSKFHVKDNLASTGVGSSSSPIVIIQNERINTGTSSSVLRFDTNEISGTNQYARAAIGAEYDGSSNVNGRLMFSTADTSGALQERVRISGGGNTILSGRLFFNGATQGIFWSTDGTSEDLWHIQSNASGDLDFVESGVAANRLYLKTGGNVGIGTNNPSQKLDVAGSIKFGTSTSQNIIGDFGSVDTYLINYNTDASASIRFHVGGGTSGDEMMRVSPNGRVSLHEGVSTVRDGQAWLYHYNTGEIHDNTSNASWRNMYAFTAASSALPTRWSRVISVRLDAYITSGPYWYTWRLYNAREGAPLPALGNGYPGGGYSSTPQNYISIGGGVSHRGSVHTWSSQPTFYFDATDVVAGDQLYVQMTPSNSSGGTTFAYTQECHMRYIKIWYGFAGPDVGAAWWGD